jgi:hypothetical protein
MRTGKNRQRVNIVCNDGSFIKGTVYLNEGERMLDFINDARKDFIAVTETELYHTDDVRSFKLATMLWAKKKFIVLNKSSIRWIEEI